MCKLIRNIVKYPCYLTIVFIDLNLNEHKWVKLLYTKQNESLSFSFNNDAIWNNFLISLRDAYFKKDQLILNKFHLAINIQLQFSHRYPIFSWKRNALCSQLGGINLSNTLWTKFQLLWGIKTSMKMNF